MLSYIINQTSQREIGEFDPCRQAEAKEIEISQ